MVCTTCSYGKHITLRSLQGPPSPPPGSQYDQSTLDYMPDVGIAITAPVSQSLINDGTKITGFGVVIARQFFTDKNLWIGLASKDQITNYPTDPTRWYRYGFVKPEDFVVNAFYIVWAEFPDDPVIVSPSQEVYICLLDKEGSAEPWIWAGFSKDVYPRGLLQAYIEGSWRPISGAEDATFFTWTEREVTRCEDYTTKEECEAHGCYWYDNSCHSYPKPEEEKPWYEKYLPYILIGVGATMIAVAIAKR